MKGNSVSHFLLVFYLWQKPDHQYQSKVFLYRLIFFFPSRQNASGIHWKIVASSTRILKPNTVTCAGNKIYSFPCYFLFSELALFSLNLFHSSLFPSQQFFFRSCFFPLSHQFYKEHPNMQAIPTQKICTMFQVCTHDNFIISVPNPVLRGIKVPRHLPSIFLLHVLVSEARYWRSYQFLSKTHCKVWLISSANQPNFLSVTLIFTTKRPSHVLHQQNTSFKRGPTHVSTDAHK